ncbi:hypothetical protein DQ238_14925 [Geodermatophilus sp. TF02-6]|nr:hypothetical protein DQ238_14925 [Geodermatophilus sp. TF02-6]
MADAMAVEVRDPAAPGSPRLALLVVLRPGVVLDDALTRLVPVITNQLHAWRRVAPTSPSSTCPGPPTT